MTSQRDENHAGRLGVAENLILHSQFIMIGLLVLGAILLKTVFGGD